MARGIATLLFIVLLFKLSHGKHGSRNGGISDKPNNDHGESNNYHGEPNNQIGKAEQDTVNQTEQSDDEDHDGDSDNDGDDGDGHGHSPHEEFLKQCEKICKKASRCPPVCPQAHLDPWVG